MSHSDPTLERLASRALDFVPAGGTVGLGTGRAAAAFIRALGGRMRQGLRVQGVPTSQAATLLGREFGIPLVGLADVESIDVTVDGADEVDPHLNLIKGYGGALVRERIVAAASRQEIILVGSEKLVPVLGSRGKLPVEVIPFATAWCVRQLRTLGCEPVMRMNDGEPFRSDNGNHILDCGIRPLADPAALERALQATPGVVGTGLFLGMASVVLVGDAEGIRELRRPSQASASDA